MKPITDILEYRGQRYSGKNWELKEKKGAQLENQISFFCKRDLAIHNQTKLMLIRCQGKELSKQVQRHVEQDAALEWLFNIPQLFRTLILNRKPEFISYKQNFQDATSEHQISKKSSKEIDLVQRVQGEVLFKKFRNLRKKRD